MKAERGAGHGELLRVLETVETLTSDSQDPDVIQCPRYQNRGPEVPERGYIMSDRELLEKLRSLTPENQERAIESLLEFLISQQISACSPGSTDKSCP